MRIGIVDDSAQSVEALTRLLTFVPEYELAWIANNGNQAVERCSLDTPDLVLMDLYMPVMDGVEATRQIMQNTPCSILIVTDSITEHSAQIFAAMGHGAIDVAVRASDMENGHLSEGDTLLERIATVSKLIGRSQQQRSLSFKRRAGDAPTKSPHPLVAIGSSTGGPMALATILSHLPSDFPGAVVIVQHLDAEFSQGLVSWLDGYTSLRVEVARHGAHPEVGTVGLSEAEARSAGHDVIIATTPMADIGKAVAIGETGGFIKLIAARPTGEMLGVHIVGPHATDVVQVALPHLYHHDTVFDVLRIPYPHPTLGEALSYAAEEIADALA